MITNYNSNTYQKPVEPQRVNIFYFSDYHGNVPAYRRLKTASDEFDRKHSGSENLKISGGDLTADPDTKKRTLVYRLLKIMNLDASAIGNHEWDGGYNFYKETNKLYKQAPNLLFNNFISSNIMPKDKDDIKEYEKNKLFGSKIIAKNSQKFGIIGETTPDYRYEDCKNHNTQQTMQDITQEIEKLKQQDPSLNKIILESHMGREIDKIIAQTIPDIDIIEVGHSHKTFDGIVQGENLFMSPKNEPVILVEAGNEQNFGELSVSFDPKGRIDLSPENMPVNKLKAILNYQENGDVKDLENKILGQDVFVGRTNNEFKQASRSEENLMGSLAADAILWKTGADIAMLNASTFRASLPAGDIHKRDIEYCIPFQNDAITVKCTAGDIANIIKYGVDSTKKEQVDPGLFQVGGLRYTVTPDKNLINLYTVDKNGVKKDDIIDTQGNLVPDKNPNNPKEYSVALTDHLITRFFPKIELSRDYYKKDDDKIKVNKKYIINKYDQQRNILTDYIKSEFTDKNKPIEIAPGRIKIENPLQQSSFGFTFLNIKFNNELQNYSLQRSTTE